jgi:branched-subunit amino acid aminotransferase/4-amino-4-deoxychorismate lyase
MVEPEFKVKVLETDEEIISALKEFGKELPKNLVGYYNGALKAIIKDPAFMLIPFVDKIVHRGFAVFDTASVHNGKLYNIENHLDRFFFSMGRAQIKPPNTREEIKEILLALAASTNEPSLHLRYWASRGGNDLSITTAPDTPTRLYAMAIKTHPFNGPGPSKCFTTEMPVKPTFLAEFKSTNYLINCRSGDEAKAKGGFPVSVDEEGYVMESHIFGCSFILDDGSFFTPPYKRVLISTTNDRVIALVQTHLVAKGVVKAVLREPRMLASELKERTKEMMLCGNDFVVPVTQWDDAKFGDEPGPITKQIQELYNADHEDEALLIDVPYKK